MKKHSLLLFYFVPWVTICTKAVLYLDGFHLEWLAVGVVFAAVLYMVALCALAFQWGKGKGFWFWLLASVIQYVVNIWSAEPVLADIGAVVEEIYRLLHLLSVILQVGLYFAGRRERAQTE